MVAAPNALLLRLAPALFVLLWSTGWIAARAIAPYADPLTFLAIRFTIAALALAIFAALAGARWPRRPSDVAHVMVAGVLIHAVYLGGIWWAIAAGVPTSVSGLIAAVQPILTALLAPALLRETITWRQWLGIAMGFAGIALVLSPKLAGVASLGLAAATLPLAVNVLAMVSVTLGTFYQKRFVASGDLRTVTVVQYIAAAAVTLPAAALLEPMRFELNPTTILTMTWSVLALSIGAIGLYLMLIRSGAVSRAAMLIYLVPPAVAIEALTLFGEALTPLQAAGIAVTSLGVALAVRRA